MYNSVHHFIILWNENICVTGSESYLNVNLIINVTSEYASSITPSPLELRYLFIYVSPQWLDKIFIIVTIKNFVAETFLKKIMFTILLLNIIMLSFHILSSFIFHVFYCGTMYIYLQYVLLGYVPLMLRLPNARLPHLLPVHVPNVKHSLHFALIY